MICKCYANGNNKFLKSWMLQSYKSSTYLMHLDAKKLYGHSMMQVFPTEILD